MLHNKSSLACLKEQHARLDTYNDFYSYNLDMAEKDNYLKELRLFMKENVNECECDMYNSNRVKLLIAGFHVDVMIDSGASISVLSEEFLYTIKQQSFIDVTEIKVKTCELADGSNITLHRKIRVPLKLNSMTITADLYVIPVKLVTVILGCDLLKRLNARLDFKANKLYIERPQESTKSSNDIETLGKLQINNLSHSSYCNENNVENRTLNAKLNKLDLSKSNINTEQRDKLITLLNSYEDIFANNINEIGRTNILEYDIEIPLDAKPIHLQQYKCAYNTRDIINEEVKKLLDSGQAEIANDNAWQFPCLIVNKPRSTKKRLCIDFRRCNSITPLNPQHPFDMDHFLCDIGKQRSKYFSVLDLKSAFNQIPLSKRSQKICTFASPMGAIRLKTCPFGLKNVPAVFTKLMDIVFRDIKNKFMICYLDDIIIFSQTYEQHLEHISEVFRRLRKANLTIEPEKAHLFKKTVVFLGIKISEDGIATEETNIKKIKDFPLPQTQKAVRGFVSLCSYYRKHIKDFSRIAAPLYELTKKEHKKIVLSKEAIDSFETLKHKLITAPLLTYARLGVDDPPLNLVVDSSKDGTGFVMSQLTYSKEVNKEIDKPIFYGSKNFNKFQRKLGSTELEALGVTIAVKRLESYLKGRHFNLYTDSKSLVYVLNKKLDDLKPSLSRKVMYLSQFDFKIMFRSGSSLSNADVLSRSKFEEENYESDEDNEPHIFAIDHHKQSQKNDKLILDYSDIETDNVNENNIRNGQKRDYFFRTMYNYLKNDKLPEDKLMSKRILVNKDQYFIHNNMLYHLWKYKANDQIYNQICIPEELRDIILQSLHDLKTTGHASAMKMYHSALRRFWWPGMYTQFENYVKSCKICLTATKGHYPRIALKSLPTPNQIFECIHIDLLAIKTVSNKNKYMLVMVDSLSKFLVVKCLRSKHSLQISKSLLSDWFFRFGFPKDICCCVSDNGNEFCNKLNMALYDILKVKSIRTSYYKPSSNGECEIFNKSILSILRKLAKDEPKKWSSMVPYAVMAINSRVNDTTSYSAFQLMHGVSMLDPLDLQLPYIPDNVTKSKQQAYKYWSDNLQHIRNIAAQNINDAKKKQKHFYDRTARPNPFKIGDKVFMKVEKWDQNSDTKLKNYYKGKFTIVGFHGDTNAILVDEKGKRMQRSVYINKLKKCVDRISQTTAKYSRHKGESKQKTDDIESIPLNRVEERDCDQCSDSDYDGDTIIDESDSESDSTIDEVDVTENSLIDKRPVKKDEDIVENSQDTVDSVTDAHTHRCNTETISNTSDKETIVNKPTEEYFEDDIETVEPIHKVYRKRILSDGSTQYYVSFKSKRAKKDRTWINETDMTPSLQDYARNRKLQLTKSNIRMLHLLEEE